MIVIMKKINLKGFGKRQVTLLSLVVMIAVAGYINLTQRNAESLPVSGELNQSDIIEIQATPIPTPEPDDYFTTSRMERDRNRSAAMEVYREVSDNRDSDRETKKAAQDNLTASASAMETEAVLEGLIRAKGFEDVIVYISGAGANIIVKTVGLTPAQTAQIKDMAKETAKISSDRIKIVEIK